MTTTDNAASLTRLLDEAAIRDATARFAEAATNAALRDLAWGVADAVTAP